MKKLALLSVALVAMLPLGAAARVRVGGGFGFRGSGPRVGVFVGPRFVPYGWYGWGSAYYWPYSYPGRFYYYSANSGQIKLNTHEKDAEVYIDGAYAGTAGKLKSMSMPPGSYDVEIRAEGHPPFDQKVYVVAGKTIELHPDF